MRMAEDHSCLVGHSPPPIVHVGSYCRDLGGSEGLGQDSGWPEKTRHVARALLSHPVDPVGRFGHLGWAGSTGPATKALVPI